MFSGPRTQCLNCECELAGPFCHECGQTASIERYRIKRIGTEIYEQFRKIDVLTTLRTVWLLTTKPGDFVTGYLAGRRVGFLNPVKFFFYSFVAQILFGTLALWVTSDHRYDYLIKIDYQIEFIGLASTVFWGMFWSLLFRRSGLNLVENIAAAIFFIGQSNFLGLLITFMALPLNVYYPNTVAYSSLGEVTIELLYGFYFAHRLFNERIFLLIPKQVVLSLLFIFSTLVVIYGKILIDALTIRLGLS